MNIYDVTQELFNCEVYPGDPAPQREILAAIKSGGVCNLTAFSMCAHNGTHIDAPYHFFDNGATIDQIPLSKMVGYAFVAEHSGIVGDADAHEILKKAEGKNAESVKRILIKGDVTVSAEAARVFANAGVELLGNESQTVGPKDAPMAVHKILLSAEVVLLEGIRLSCVPEGVYFLSAAPLSLGKSDGAPCRAILIGE